MILHDENDYSEYNVESPKAMSAYWKCQLHGRRMQDDEQCMKDMYDGLPAAKKRVINVLIQDLMSKSKRWKLFRVYLEKFIEEENSLNKLETEKKIKKLETYIFSYMKVSQKHTVEEREIVHSAMQSLRSTNAPREKNKYVPVLADFFNVSKDVLLAGQGERYNLNYEYIQKILDDKNEDYNVFVNKVCNHGQRVKGTTNIERKNYAFFVNHSYRVFAEFASELLGVGIDKILITEPCWVELDKYPFIEFYNELNYDKQTIVQHALFNLTLK